jgi:hypothetical protein
MARLFQHEHRVGADKKLVVDADELARDAGRLQFPPQPRQTRKSPPVGADDGMQSHLARAHADEFLAGGEVPVEIEAVRVAEEQVRAEHEVEGAVEKR